MFKVGQPVVCIAYASNIADPYLPMKPIVGRMYHVRSLHFEEHLEGYGVRLDELLNPIIPWKEGGEYEWSFSSTIFRPLTKQEQELSMEVAQ